KARPRRDLPWHPRRPPRPRPDGAQPLAEPATRRADDPRLPPQPARRPRRQRDLQPHRRRRHGGHHQHRPRRPPPPHPPPPTTPGRPARATPHPDGIPWHEYTWRTVFLHSLVGRDQGLASEAFGVEESRALFDTAFPGLPPSQVQSALRKVQEAAYYLHYSK